MQGWSPDFVPKLVEDSVDAKYFDRIVPVAGKDALRLARELATREGIFVGTSAGATLAAALSVAGSAPAGSNILCMLPDTGERYLTTPLFADIPTEMTTEETEISRSTPRFRFDAPPPPPTAPAAAAAKEAAAARVSAAVVPEPTAAAGEFVGKVTSDPDSPVLMFALEWCEFCWSVRRMFAAYGIPYTTVDLDSVEYQQDNWGGQIRTALSVRTQMKTIPQLFVGGEFVGGASDAFDAWREGRLQAQLERAGIRLPDGKLADPYSFLPGWLHPR
jgi:cysteine synthase A